MTLTASWLLCQLTKSAEMAAVSTIRQYMSATNRTSYRYWNAAGTTDARRSP